MEKVTATLNERLASLISAMGYEFVGCTLSHSGRRQGLVRVYIDHANGVTVDDCARVSYQISAMLDVEDPVQGHYTLEVSSPGLNRPLFTLAHYQQHIGQSIKVRVRSPINAKRQFVGTLLNVVGDNIYLQVEVDTTEVVLPFSNIEKANIIADIR